MAIIRTAKGLQEATAETLKDRLQRLELPQTTSAAQADALGATPKQVDMASTQARKQAVIKENITPKQDRLALSQRYAQQQAALTGGQQQQLDQATQLAKLAGLDTRIQKLAEDRINQAGQQPVQRQSDETELGELIPTTDPRYQQAAAALVEYANDPSKQEQALVTLTNMGITPDRVNGLLETTDAALGRATDPTAIRGSDLDASLRDMGYAGGILELSQQLGKDVSTMDVEDLVSEVQAYRNKVTAEKEKLEAQALSQTGIQQQAAMQQLQTFQQAGGIGQEQAVERALAPIDMASTVKVGDQDMRVDQLLQDQEFSDLIEQWARSSPEDREKLIPSAQFGGLVQWMTQNEQSIKQAAQAGQQAQQQFGETQQQVKTLGTDAIQDKNLIAALVPGFDSSKAYTASDLANFQQQLQSSPAYQFASSEEGRTYINSFKPDELPQLQGMSIPDLQRQAAAYQNVKGSTGLQMRFDLDPATKVFTEPQLQAVENYSQLVKAHPHLQSIGEDEDFKSLTNDQLKYFDKDGQLNGPMVEEFKQFIAEQKAMIADSDEDAVQDVFGGTAAEMNAKRAELQARADYGDQDAIAALAEMNKFDVTGPDGKPDGVIDAKDARQMSAARKAELAGKDAEYFKQQYGTGAQGYQTLGEKTTAAGTKIAASKAKGAYAALKDAMVSGDFSEQIELASDPTTVATVLDLMNSYEKSGIKNDNYRKLSDTVAAMKQKYIEGELAGLDLKNMPLEPGPDGRMTNPALDKMYSGSKHPFAKDVLAAINQRIGQILLEGMQSQPATTVPASASGSTYNMPTGKAAGGAKQAKNQSR